LAAESTNSRRAAEATAWRAVGCHRPGSAEAAHGRPTEAAAGLTDRAAESTWTRLGRATKPTLRRTTEAASGRGSTKSTTLLGRGATKSATRLRRRSTEPTAGPGATKSATRLGRRTTATTALRSLGRATKAASGRGSTKSATLLGRRTTEATTLRALLRPAEASALRSLLRSAEASTRCGRRSGVPTTRLLSCFLKLLLKHEVRHLIDGDGRAETRVERTTSFRLRCGARRRSALVLPHHHRALETRGRIALHGESALRTVRDVVRILSATVRTEHAGTS